MTANVDARKLQSRIEKPYKIRIFYHDTKRRTPIFYPTL